MTDDAAVISRYLLHDLPQPEREEVERRYFADPEYLELVEAVEGDLIDAYVRRELSAAQRSRFEKYFLCTRARRERLRIAEALQQHVPARRRAWPRAALALAASLVLIAGIVVWLLATRQSPPAVVDQPAPQTARAVAPRTVTLAVTLLPGLTRDTAEPQKIVLTRDVEQVRVHALVEVEGEWRDLRATVGDWSASNLTMNADRTVTVTIPAAVLTPGEHVLVLTSGNEPLADYAFVVEKIFRAP